MDLISVVVPIYNLDAYLYQCVSSILQQTYRNLEVILVDDGSTDNAIEICELFRKSDPRVQVISKPNGGLVSARKAGVNASKGDYLYYVDGDDWIEPDCIEQYYHHAKRDAADIVIGNYRREFLGNFVTMRNTMNPGYYDREAIEKSILPTMIYDGIFFNHGIRTYSWGKMYRRNIVEHLQNNVPNEVVVAEDAAVVYPAIYQAASVTLTDIVGCNYRQRPNSILKSTNLDPSESRRIARAFSYLSTTLEAESSAYNFLHQLRAYFAATTIIRFGGFLNEEDNYRKFNFFGAIPRHSRLALYISGSFGQHVFLHIQASTSYHLAGWFDMDYQESQLLKMPVRNPKDLRVIDFDYLIVPSFDPQVHKEVHQLFDSLGLPKAKIRPVHFDPRNLAAFIESLGFDATTFMPLPGQP